MITLEEGYKGVAKGFAISNYSVGEDSLSFRVIPKYSHDASFNLVKESFRGTKVYPFYRKSGRDYFITLVIHKGREFSLPAYAHILLIIATLITVTLAGYIQWAKGNIIESIVFSISLMTILMGHELGHYIQARIRKVKATLPFFIPVPPNIFPFGTMGAVITMSEPLTDRSTILRVGIAGPIVGFLLSIPVIYYGLMHSTIVPSVVAYKKSEIIFVMPLAMQLISMHIFGNIAHGMSIEPNPLAMAGWIGLFVTALNLIPIGQLDGGHVIRALFPERYTTIYRGAFILLIVLGLFIWPGWLFWAFIVYLLTRLKHPGPLNDVSGLSRMEKLLGIVYILLLALSFVPVPFLMR